MLALKDSIDFPWLFAPIGDLFSLVDGVSKAGILDTLAPFVRIFFFGELLD